MSMHQKLVNLCAICGSIFSTPLEELIQEDFREHHKTFTDFENAVLSKCWICYKAWRSSFTEKTDSTMSFDAYWSFEGVEDFMSGSTSMIFRVYCEFGDEQDILLFDVSNTTADSKRKIQKTVDLEKSTSSLHSLSCAQDWIRECELDHSNCERGYSIPRYTPTRLIHIGATGDEWKLHLRKEILSATSTPPRYIALSYMWGQHQQLLLQQSNLENFRLGLPISTTLPKTFQDLIQVSRYLSVKYVWIDALCIIQDSPEDWTAESMRMRDVYSNSYCTIAASWGTDPTAGLFVDRDLDLIGCGTVQTSWEFQERKYITVTLREHDACENQISSSPLHRRGWALQERLLPPRTLYFTKQQIIFDCDSHMQCEAFQADDREFHSQMAPPSRIYSWHEIKDDEDTHQTQSHRQARDSEAFRRGWFEIVTQYSKCRLTNGSDRLIALGGLADLFQHLTSDEYLSGLWRSNIWTSMLWFTEGIFDECPLSIPSTNTFPSFSWASVDGPVDFEHVTGEEQNYHPFQLLEASHDRLILHGFAPLYDPYSNSTTPGNFMRNLCGSPRYDDLNTETSVHLYAIAPSAPIYVLLLSVRPSTQRNSEIDERERFGGNYHGFGIIVRRTGDADVERGVECVRLGLFASYRLKDRRLAAFGLQEDGSGNLTELEGFKKTKFVLK